MINLEQRSLSLDDLDCDILPLHGSYLSLISTFDALESKVRLYMLLQWMFSSMMMMMMSEYDEYE